MDKTVICCILDESKIKGRIKMNKKLNFAVTKKVESASVSTFTMIEILTVVALLAFLMAISVAGYQIAMSKAAESDTKSIIAQIEIAMESYKAKTGYYIQQVDGDAFLIDTPVDDVVDFTDFLPDYEKWRKNGSIMTSTNVTSKHCGSYILVDSYGNSFWFRSPGYHNRGSFELESAGQDLYFGYYADAKGETDQGKDKNYGFPENKTHSKIALPDKQSNNISNWD
jgi:type II secretory pathway pseudopilin PulG